MSNIFKRLSNSSIVQAFISKPTPKWMVYLADLVIFGVSCGLTFFFGTTNTGDSFLSTHIFHAFAAFAVYALLALILGTSRYIIRLSVIEDTYRLVLLIVLASVVLCGISLATYAAYGVFYFRFWNIFTLGMMTFALMLVMRLTIKYLYINFSKTDRNKKRVIVLGSAINSFYLASALKGEFEGSFEPVALLSLSSKEIHSSVNGIPIINFNPDTVAEVFSYYRCDTLLFLSTQLELMRSGQADIFLRNHIKLLMLNQVAEFDMNSQSMPKISTHVQDIRIEDLLGREPIRTENPDIRRVIKGQTVMITGAAGSIGSEIVRQVAMLDASDIVLLDQAETPMHDMQLEMESTFPDMKIHLFIGDVANRAWSTHSPNITPATYSTPQHTSTCP